MFCDLDLQVEDVEKNINELDYTTTACEWEVCKQLIEGCLLAFSSV